MSSNSEVIIKGVTTAGKKFRPSDWAERLASVLSTFGHDQKMVYSPYVKPTTIDGVKSVIIDRKFQEVDPRAFNFLMAFARDNELQVVDKSQTVNS